MFLKLTLKLVDHCLLKSCICYTV